MSDTGPQSRSLLMTRRLLVVMLAVMLVSVVALAGMRVWPELGASERVGLVGAVALVSAGTALSRRDVGLWLCVGAMLLLSATATFSPAGSPPWLPMPNIASYAGFMSIVLVGRRLGPALAVCGAALVAVIWSQRPTNVVSSSLQIGGGWIVVAQSLLAGLALCWAWGTLRLEALEADRDVMQRDRRADESIAMRERSRMWRQTVLRLHESVLNSIRYVLSEREPDRERLGRQLQASPLPPEQAEVDAIRPLDRLIADVLVDPVAAEVLRPPSRLPRAEVDPDVAAAARAAITEAVHNAVRHGGASEVRVHFETEPDGVLVVRITDNGAGIRPDARPGIGMSEVLAESLSSVGGAARISSGSAGGTEVRITLPARGVASTSWRRPRSFTPFDKGRLMITAPIAGSALVGALYYLLLMPVRPLDRTGGAHIWLAVGVGLAGSAVAALLVRRRRHCGVLAGIGLISMPALLPWFLRTTDYGCGQSPVVSAALNTAGFAVIVIGAWAGPVPAAYGVLVWGMGSSIIAAQMPMECREGVALAMANSLLIIPVAMLATYVGIRTAERAAAKVSATRRRESIERGRAAAEADLNASLHGSVEEATALLQEVAGGAAVDDALRARLERVDARIRAAIQVDSARAGGLASCARRVIDDASDAGVTVSVRAVRCSDDQRPLPPAVQDMLSAAVRGARGVVPVLQVFTDGQTDFISVLVDRQGLDSAGISPHGDVVADGVRVQVLAEDSDEGGPPPAFSLLVSRDVASSDDLHEEMAPKAQR